MQTLSNLPGKSVVGYGVLLLVFIFSFFGVDIKADAPALTAAIGNFINATSSLIQAISILVGFGLTLWDRMELARKHNALRQIAFEAGVPAPVINSPVAHLALSQTPGAISISPTASSTPAK